jgi:hypothetical protein
MRFFQILAEMTTASAAQLSNLQQIQAQAKAQMAQRKQGNELAFAGQRYFA